MYDGVLEIMNDVDCVGGNLYIGGLTPDTSKFDYVICVTPEGKHYDRAGKFTITAPFNDVGTLPPIKLLTDIVGMTLWCLANGKTLVQCSAGLNRSGLVVALTMLSMGTGWKAQDAVDHLRKIRSCSVLHNQTFLDYVLKANPVWSNGVFSLR